MAVDPYHRFMSHAYVTMLVTVTVVAVVARLVLPMLPVRRYAVRLSVTETLAVVVGAAALVLHCGAMFFRASVATWPAGPSVIRVVDPMGTASITWYAIGAALIVLGLRHQHPLVVAIVAASLAAVGFTMYDGGPLRTHLDTIAVAVVLLVAAVAAFADPPWRVGAAGPVRPTG
jgi:hypothetical protein